MKPSSTGHIARSISRSLGGNLRIDGDGILLEEPPFPDVNLPTDVFRHQYFLYNLLRKREVQDGGLREVAVAAFLKTEQQCYQIEQSGSILDNLDWLAKWSILRARQLCHDVLGSVPHDWYRECVFTGGASTSRGRSSSHPALKWWASPPLDVTPLALPYLEAFKSHCDVIDAVWDDPGALSSDSTLGRRWYKIVPGSRLETVPKSYKTDRVIMIEPDGNMLLQKGVGNCIRKRLRRYGVNLNSQTYNQKLALAGSRDGSLGTIDLSAASDSVTLAILRILLPEDWYSLVWALRSHYYFLDGKWHKMVKCSSMGNGFTFELESLVFFCLTRAVVDLLKPTDRRIAIFGDDIIVASSVCGALESVLNRCGFLLNKEKSFWRGPFRESCGKHYHAGADVTPVYMKSSLECLSQRYRLYNQVRMWAGGEFYDRRYAQVLDSILATIPLRDRCQVPLEYSSTSGLWFGDVCTKKIRMRMRRSSLCVLDFWVYTPKTIDLTDRIDSECAWFYRFCEGWAPSDTFGFSEYAPLRVERQGGLVHRRVAIPAVVPRPSP